MSRSKNMCGGFTLIELMIVVAVVAILAMIAYPSYQDQVRKSRRGSAQSLMMSIANRQEQIYLDTRSYAAAADNAAVATAFSVAIPTDVQGFYTLSAATDLAAGDDADCGGTGANFRILATAVGAQAADGDLKLCSNGRKIPDTKW